MFYEWVTTRRAGDTRVGTSSETLRDVFKRGGESHCEFMMGGACREAKDEQEKLRREYDSAGMAGNIDGA